MAKYNYVHIGKLADQSLPDALLDAVLKEHQSCAGIAIIGANEEYLGTFLQAEGTNTKDVQTLLANHKDKACVLSFASFPEGTSKENIQPFVGLFDNDGNTTLSGFLSGDFESKAKAGGDESPELQVWKRLVLPQILKAAKNYEDDAGQTYQEMASDPALAELMNMFYKDTGAITLVCNDGMITWGEGYHRESPYPWGWVTNPCGYTEVKAAEPKSSAAKSGGFGSGLSFGAKPEGLKPEVKTATSKVSLPAASDAPATGYTDADWEWGAPSSSWTKEQKKRFYSDHNIFIDGKRLPAGQGIVPEGYKNCPKVRVPKATIVAAAPIKDFKDIPKQTVVPSNGQVTADILPVIPPTQKAWFQNTFLKKGHVQKTMSEGKTIIDPKRVQGLNKDWPTFVEEGGLQDIRQTLFYSVEDRLDIIKNMPNGAERAWGDLAFAYYKLLEELGRLDIKSEAEIKETHVAASQTLRPEKKVASGGGGFGGSIGFGKK